jgi:hypothetical protein
MPDWKDRVLKALYVSTDHTGDFQLLELPLRELWDRANIRYMCQVRTEVARANDFVMVIDDDGYDRQLPWNPRAQYLSQYPADHGIVGGALFFSEAWEGGGIDLIDLTQTAQDWLMAESRKHSYLDWRMTNKNLFARHGYIVE